MNILKIVALALLALLPTAASADPTSAAYIAISNFVSTYGAYIYAAVVAVGVYGASNARRKMRAEAARQKAEYNSSLTDRSQSLLSPNPPHRVVYGRAITGGDVVAIFTTDKQGVDKDGNPYTKADAYKHLVIHIASHEIESIEEIFIDGIALGPLDANGDVINTSLGTAKDYVTGSALTRGATLIPVVSGTGTILANDEISFPGETKRYKVLSGITAPGTLTIAAPGLLTDIPLGSAVNLGNEFNRNAPIARSVTLAAGASVTVATPIDDILISGYTDGTGDSQQWTDVVPTISVDRLTITNPHATATLSITYSAKSRLSSVRIKKHLGTDTQTVDTYLNGLVPLQWTVNHRLQGLAYVVVTVDLEEPIFQAWTPSGIVFDVKGRKVFDPRTSTTYWTQNAALCIRDYLLAPWGFECSTTDIDNAQAIAAANACDELIDLTIGTETQTNQKRYTVNGVFTTSDSPESVLNDLSVAMAGDTIYGARWLIQPGVWTAPVTLPDGRDELTDDDLDGAITIVQAGESLEGLFNGVRGNYIPAGRSSPSDYEPYQNAAFLLADGRPLWTNVDLPYTDNKARAKNISRILTEKNRDGLVINYPAKLIAWPLTVGDRIRVSSTEMAWTRKIFRVTDWQFGISAPVMLTLQEDTETAYDEADAAVADPSPNSGLSNPSRVGRIKNLTATSGNATFIKLGDGTVVPRVRLSWDPVTDPYIADGTGYIMVGVLAPRSPGWLLSRVPGNATSTYITGVREGDTVALGAYAVNGIGVQGEPVFISHSVLGKTDAPIDVTGLAYEIKPGIVVASWDPCPDSDYSSTELRTGLITDTWATSAHLWTGTASEYHHPRPPNGVYRVFAKHIDTSGNYSTNAAFMDVTVTDAIDPVASGAQLLKLNSTGFAFIFDSEQATTTTSPTIDFTVQLQGITGSVTFTAVAYNAANASLGSVTLTGSGPTTRSLTSANFNALGALTTRYVKVTATLGSLSETMTIYRGDNGSRTIQARLSNETHTLAAAADGTVVSYAGSGTTVEVFEGIVPLNYDGVGTANGTWTAAIVPSNIAAATPVDSGTFLTLGPANSMSADQALITFMIAGKSMQGVAFSFPVQQSFAKSRAGTSGAGVTAYTDSGQVFISSGSGTAFTPANIVLKRTLSTGLFGGTTSWSIVSGTFTGSLSMLSETDGRMASFTPSAMGTDAVTFRCTYTVGATTYTDDIVITKSRDGFGAYLTNDSITLPASSTGAVTSYSGASGDFKVQNSSGDISTASLTFSIVGHSGFGTTFPTNTGISINSSGAYSVTGNILDATTVATVTFRASYTDPLGGVRNFDRIFTLSKSLAGTSTPGARGSLRGFSNSVSPAIYSTAPWNGATDDTNARNIIWQMLGVSGGGGTGSAPSNAHLRIGDTITLRNSAGTASAEKFWGGSAWLDPGTVISGNLLVGGTISGAVNLAITGNAVFEGINSTSIVIGNGSISVSASVIANPNGFAEVGVVGKSTTAARPGIYGYNSTGHGVYGESSSGSGVLGFANTGDGVKASAMSGNGVNALGGIAGSAVKAVGAGSGTGRALECDGFNVMNGRTGVRTLVVTSGSGAGAKAVEAISASGTALEVTGLSVFSGRITSTISGNVVCMVLPRVTAKPAAILGGVCLHNTLGLIVSDGTNWYGPSGGLVVV